MEGSTFRIFCPATKTFCYRCYECINNNNYNNYIKYNNNDNNKILLNGVKKVGIVKTENLMGKEDCKKNSQNEFKNNWYEKRMYGQFLREMPGEIDKDLPWKWLVQSDFKVQTEATICAAQEQALMTNYTNNDIDKTSENPLCRMCGETEKL